MPLSAGPDLFGGASQRELCNPDAKAGKHCLSIRNQWGYGVLEVVNGPSRSLHSYLIKLREGVVGFAASCCS